MATLHVMFNNLQTCQGMNNLSVEVNGSFACFVHATECPNQTTGKGEINSSGSTSRHLRAENH